MAQIQCFALGLGMVGVDEYKLGINALLHQTERNGGTDKTTTDNCNFSWI